MTDSDALLSSLWAQDEAPARDPGFRLSVMDGVARRRLRADLIIYGSLAAGLGAAAWGLAPWLTQAAAAAWNTVGEGGAAMAAVATAVAGLSLLRPLSATFSRT